MSWDDNYCGGWPRIRLENSDGTDCETNEKYLAAGATVVWSFHEGLDSCSNMMVTQNTTLFIQTSSRNDFCPKNVLVTPVNGPAYTTNKISDWYAKETTNNKMHLLQESKSTI